MAKDPAQAAHILSSLRIIMVTQTKCKFNQNEGHTCTAVHVKSYNSLIHLVLNCEAKGKTG